MQTSSRPQTEIYEYLVADGVPLFLTLPEVAELARRSKHAVWRDVQCERLRASRIGGKGSWRVNRHDLADYLAIARPA